MFKYKLVIADVDGTLIPPKAAPTFQLSKRLIDAVTSAQSSGVYVSLATARSLDWVDGLLESLHITSPVILDNGARIYHPSEKRYIFESFIPEKLISGILAVFQKFDYPVHSYAEDKRITYSATNPPPLTKVSKMMILHIKPSEAEIVYQAVRGVPGIEVTKSISGADPVVESIHVTNKKARKDLAVKYVAKKLNVIKNEIIGIGDSYNDKEFLEACGFRVAVENAVAEIKNMADYIAPSYKDDGVAHVIEKFILEKY